MPYPFMQNAQPSVDEAMQQYLARKGMSRSIDQPGDFNAKRRRVWMDTNYDPSKHPIDDYGPIQEHQENAQRAAMDRSAKMRGYLYGPKQGPDDEYGSAPVPVEKQAEFSAFLAGRKPYQPVTSSPVLPSQIHTVDPAPMGPQGLGLGYDTSLTQREWEQQEGRNALSERRQPNPWPGLDQQPPISKVPDQGVDEASMAEFLRQTQDAQDLHQYGRTFPPMPVQPPADWTQGRSFTPESWDKYQQKRQPPIGGMPLEPMESQASKGDVEQRLGSIPGYHEASWQKMVGQVDSAERLQNPGYVPPEEQASLSAFLQGKAYQPVTSSPVLPAQAPKTQDSLDFFPPPAFGIGAPQGTVPPPEGGLDFFPPPAFAANIQGGNELGIPKPPPKVTETIAPGGDIPYQKAEPGGSALEGYFGQIKPKVSGYVPVSSFGRGNPNALAPSLIAPEKGFPEAPQAKPAQAPQAKTVEQQLNPAAAGPAKPGAGQLKIESPFGSQTYGYGKDGKLLSNTPIATTDNLSPAERRQKEVLDFVNKIGPAYGPGEIVNDPYTSQAEKESLRRFNANVGQQRAMIGSELMGRYLQGDQNKAELAAKTSEGALDRASREKIARMEADARKNQFLDYVITNQNLTPDQKLAMIKERGLAGTITVSLTRPTATGGSPAPSPEQAFRDANKAAMEAPRDEDFNNFLKSAFPGTELVSDGKGGFVPNMKGTFNVDNAAKALMENERLRKGGYDQLAQKLANAPGTGGREALMKYLATAIIRKGKESGAIPTHWGGYVGKEGGEGMIGGSKIVNRNNVYEIQNPDGSTYRLDVGKLAEKIPGLGVSQTSDYFPTILPGTKSMYKSQADTLTPLLQALLAQE